MLEPLNKEIFKVLGDIDQIHGEIENQIMEEEEKFSRKIDLKTLILLLDRVGELLCRNELNEQHLNKLREIYKFISILF
jgi:hypothetical protein